MGAIVIRHARPADDGTLRDVFRRSSLSNDADRANLLANPDLLEWTAESVGEGRTQVAVLDERVVGFATTTTAADALELDDLVVDPEWMRRGIGRALVMHVAALARARKLRESM